MSFHRLMLTNVRSGFGGLMLAALLTTSGAHAADYLRGAYGGHHGVEPIGQPQSKVVDWAGVYVGGHGGLSNVAVDASNRFRHGLATSALPNSAVVDLLAATVNFRKLNKTRSSFGAFAGANYLWDDVMLGVEVDYTRSNINYSSSYGPYSLTNASGQVISSGTARVKVSDWATLRGRVGWAAGYFMPYLTAGMAFGDIDGRATVTGTWVGNGAFSGAAGRSGFTYGAVVGAGVDMAFFSNVFVRAEWQHIQFASSANRADISINTARLAGGVKF